ncbi:MAG: WxL domain-containing protein [Patulibacter sp.]
MTSHKLFISVGLAAAAAGATVPASALADVTATQVVNGGSLEFINGTPSDVTFDAVTLNGTDQFATQTQNFDVSDASGSNAGWNITATSTTFKTDNGHELATDATTIQSAPDLTNLTGTLPTNVGSYPFTLPAAASAPTASKMFIADTNTGMGQNRVTPTWRLAIPAATYAGGATHPYTSTWTFTLVTGP